MAGQNITSADAIIELVIAELLIRREINRQ